MIRSLIEEISEELKKNSELTSDHVRHSEAVQIVQCLIQRHMGKWVRFSDVIRHEVPEDLKGIFFEEARQMSRRRSSGYPLQYILGYQFFLNHEYQVTPDVLIPRPETEILVSVIIDFISIRKGSLKGLEVGLGSGIISIELLSSSPRLEMIATEISPSAQEVAKRNAEKILHLPQKLKIVTPTTDLDCMESVHSQFPKHSFDFIVSNPPYLHAGDEIQKSVRSFEPAHALFPTNQNPNHFYEDIAQRGPSLLKDGGRIFVEIPAERAGEISQIFESQGVRVDLIQDLGSSDRVLVGHKD